MKRAEVWLAALPQPAGVRPVLIVTRDRAIRVRTRVTVAQVTTRVRGIDTEVPVGPAHGLPVPSVANCDELVTIPKEMLTKKIGSLDRESGARLDRALSFALGISLWPRTA